jgi:hypothetical protein
MRPATGWSLGDLTPDGPLRKHYSARFGQVLGIFDGLAGTAASS